MYECTCVSSICTPCYRQRAVVGAPKDVRCQRTPPPVIVHCACQSGYARVHLEKLRLCALAQV